MLVAAVGMAPASTEEQHSSEGCSTIKNSGGETVG